MDYVDRVLAEQKTLYPNETEFHKALQEVLVSLRPLLNRCPHYEKHAILERVVEPERVISFRINWVDDAGQVQVNRGYRIQYSSVLGPFKGGFRFHPSVNRSILRFLGFEQVFKNSLTGLMLGGGKGGADFDPKGKSDNEVMRFCQAFMTEMYRHIGMTTDVPAGDIGVGRREIAYMFGQYKKITNTFEGILTGKPIPFGGSLIRTEATGYGAVYLAQEMLATREQTFKDKTCVISGAGNVAIYCIEKLYQLGALPVTVSDSKGMIYHAEGINHTVLKQVKEIERASLTRYAELCPKAVYTPVAEYPAGRNPLWSVKCDVAFPCATQNELNLEDAKALLANGCFCVAEGANMPATLEAAHAFAKAGILFGPGKMVNAGGVATSQLEMAQNASMQQWSVEKVDAKLQRIMSNIHATAFATAKEFGEPNNLVLGANIAGFRKVAEAMIEQGV